MAGLLVGFAASLLVLLLAAVGSEFQGADDAAGEAIVEIAPGTEPWFEPFWLPEEGMETPLFALQAAVGGSVIGYFFARKRLAD
ncbi:MAG: energy-coupling factor ABC transporter substrate-binding protein [Chloroflexota bacterium]